MINNQQDQKIKQTTAAIITAVIAFITIFLVTGWVLTVYGQNNLTEYHEMLSLPNEKMQSAQYQMVKESILSGPYALTLNITQDAANKTEGQMINQYVQNIENQTRG